MIAYIWWWFLSNSPSENITFYKSLSQCNSKKLEILDFRGIVVQARYLHPQGQQRLDFSFIMTSKIPWLPQRKYFLKFFLVQAVQAVQPVQVHRRLILISRWIIYGDGQAYRHNLFIRAPNFWVKHFCLEVPPWICGTLKLPHFAAQAVQAGFVQ